jgi:fatty acid desaturase
MEYHLEHHMYPMVPSYNLKKLRGEIDDQLPKPFNSLFDFYRQVLPSVIALATNSNKYYKVNLSSDND